MANNSVNAPNDENGSDELIGTLFVGRYELQSVLGTGGMGVIYRGQQVFLDRPVAVKLLKSQDISAKARTRFHQEAKAASALNHPGIVSIIDFGVDELDRPYMVMEFVEGCTLSELLSERLVLSLEDCLPVFLEACDALSAAHKRGIVHRDVKPSNIMLVVSDSGDVHIKLLDFGIAKVVDYSEHTIQELTKTGDTLGTPLYMSPEQIDSKTVTYQSDLYSLGCTMYACLTGAPPFVGQTHIETMEMHAKEEPMTLKEASEGLDFPPELEAIISRLLEKIPAKRFTSAAEVREALISMAAAVKEREMKQRSDNRISLRNWNASSGGMSSSVSNSVHNSLAGRAAIAPSRSRPSSIANSEVKSDSESLYWNSDLADRIDKAREKTSARRNEKEGTEKAFLNRGILFSSVAIFIAVLGASAYMLLPGNFLNTKSTAAVLPAARKTVDEAAVVKSEKISAVTNASNSPESEVSSADTVIEKIIREEPQRSSISFDKMYGLTDAGLTKLTQLKSLKALTASGMELTDNSIKIISHLDLTNLVIDNNDTVSDWGLLELASMAKLQSLSICGLKNSDRGLIHLARAKGLKCLCLDGNRQISEVGVKNLSPATSALELLSMIKCDAGDDVGREIVRFRSLSGIALSANPRISDHLIDILAQRPEQLRYLLLSDCSITEAGLKKLKAFSHLRILDLSGISLSESDLSVLSTMKQLKTLGIANCGLTSTQLDALRKALPKTAILEDRQHLPASSI